MSRRAGSAFENGHDAASRCGRFLRGKPSVDHRVSRLRGNMPCSPLTRFILATTAMSRAWIYAGPTSMFALALIVRTQRKSDPTVADRSRLDEGARIFESSSAACHARNEQKVGPSLNEISGLCKSNPDGIVAWARSPGRKRGTSPMPPFGYLGNERLQLVAEYMLHEAAH